MLARATKIGTLLVMSASALTLGFFVLMAESGGKDSRPDVLAPLVFAIATIAFGVRSQPTQRPAATVLLCVVAAALAPLPVFLPARRWVVGFSACWWACFAMSAVAALSSRRHATARIPHRRMYADDEAANP